MLLEGQSLISTVDGTAHHEVHIVFLSSARASSPNAAACDNLSNPLDDGFSFPPAPPKKEKGTDRCP